MRYILHRLYFFYDGCSTSARISTLAVSGAFCSACGKTIAAAGLSDVRGAVSFVRGSGAHVDWVFRLTVVAARLRSGCGHALSLPVYRSAGSAHA